MSCNEIQNLDAYADGELPADERARVRDGLALLRDLLEPVDREAC
jgi:anti-sigma factor RsiW